MDEGGYGLWAGAQGSGEGRGGGVKKAGGKIWKKQKFRPQAVLPLLNSSLLLASSA